MRAAWIDRRIILAGVLGLIVGCAPLTSRSEPSAMQLADRATGLEARSPSDVLTAEEIASTGVDDLSVVIRRLRPRFLRSASARLAEPPEIAVYINGTFAGDASTLATVPATAVRQVVFVRFVEAFARFGFVCHCRDGAILLTTGSR